MIAKRLTTFVIAIRPTFWLKEVIGRQPKTEDKLLTRPSQTIEPEISFSLTSRRRPIAVMAEVSPMVSVAETRNIKKNAKIASGWNSMVKGIS